VLIARSVPSDEAYNLGTPAEFGKFLAAETDKWGRWFAKLASSWIKE
jgi:hypothetical protein